ncbi:Phosphatidylinositol N-acetylglucosaminyltransferase subunit P [Glycine soja]|nr:Phosphatidylinositol N-acetylglucosaminyltransferase subunit P [Glycine soja]
MHSVDKRPPTGLFKAIVDAVVNLEKHRRASSTVWLRLPGIAVFFAVLSNRVFHNVVAPIVFTTLRNCRLLITEDRNCAFFFAPLCICKGKAVYNDLPPYHHIVRILFSTGISGAIGGLYRIQALNLICSLSNFRLTVIEGCNMESPHSVNSPRRTLSLSKKQRATVSFFDPDDITSGFGLSGDHGPKPSEVYGFVGSITTVVATVIFLVWAYAPESWLQSVGISYYPSRYWALAVPTYVMVTIVLVLGFYIGLNFISTPSPASLNTVFDEFSRDPLSLECSLEEDEKPIEPISDIGIGRINDIMFNNAT